MSVVVFSPHTDDAIFSLGSHLASLPDVVTIVTPMAGIPADGPGQAKHTTLHREHADACALLGVKHVEGPFLDDAYPRPRRADVYEWMAEFAFDATVYIPLGIHHPDHLLVSNLAITMSDIPEVVRFYAELPYRTDYPYLATDRQKHVENMTGRLRGIQTVDYPLKRAAVAAYASQVDESVLARVMVREMVWELIR